MRIPSLFLVGLLLGAAAVFLVRGLAVTESGAATEDPPLAAVHEEHAEHADHTAHTAAPAEGAAAPAEPADTSDPNRPPENLLCPVMGNEVDPEVFVDYEGRRIGFCCPGCDKAFLADPEKYLKQVDEELRARGVER